MIFCSALALGAIVTISTLLLLDNDDVDDDAQHPHRHFLLGRGMDCPLQDSARRGRWLRCRQRVDPWPSTLVFISVGDEEIGSII